MDGTLAEFKLTDEIETLYEKGYFAELKPQENVVGGIKAFITEHSDVEVYVLSSVLSDSSYALSEKNEWLDKYIPEIDEAHRIFVPCGEDKAAYVTGGISGNDILLDDYSANLHAWENQGGFAIKLMNGINGNKGTWRGERISYQNTAESFKNGLYLKIIDRQVIRDNLQKNFTEYEENKEELDYATRAIAELRRTESYREVSQNEKRAYNAEEESGLFGGNRELGNGSGIRRRGQSSANRGISGEIEERGQVSLIGRRVKDTQNLAELLQVYRNPIFETARGFYLKDGYIIASEAVSSRLPGIAYWQTESGRPFSAHVNEKAERLGADSFYMVHNHPTGDPKPSMQDIFTTKIQAELIKSFAGHIVLDHTKYSLIDEKGSYEILDIPSEFQRGTLLTASIEHPLLGKRLMNTHSLAEVGKMLIDDNNENTSFLAYMAADGSIRQIDEVSNVICRCNESFKDYVKGELLASGSMNAAIYTANEDIYENLIPMITEGYFRDVLFIDSDYGMYWSQKELGHRQDASYVFAGMTENDIEFFRQEEEIGMENVVLIEMDYKGYYERSALTMQQFNEKYKELLAKDMQPPSFCGDSYTLRPMVHMYYRSCELESEEWNDFFTDMGAGLADSDVQAGNVATIDTEEMGVLSQYLPKIQIGEKGCRIVDMWEENGNSYTLAKDLQLSGTYYAVRNDDENILIFDSVDFGGSYPMRDEVKDFFLQKEKELSLVKRKHLSSEIEI